MKNDEFHAGFLIRQHTPMIHFQANQPGALFRVSELKPAFDLFLRNDLKSFNGDFDTIKYFLVGYTSDRESDLRRQFALSGNGAEGECSLDYRLKISAYPNDTWTYPLVQQAVSFENRRFNYVYKNNGDPRLDSFPNYFGEIGGSEQPKLLTFIEDDFQIEFFSLHQSLISVIKERFAAFIARKNVGTRQSKGFGSFSVVNLANNRPKSPGGEGLFVFQLDLEEEVKAITRKQNWKSEYLFRQVITDINDPQSIERLEIYECQKLLFKHIELFWRLIRSGYNFPNKLYIKSPLFFYLNQTDIQWDKRSIKERYFNSRSLNEQGKGLDAQLKKYDDVDILESYGGRSIKGNRFLIRDMLGLSSSADWLYYGDKIEKTHQPQQNHETIDRYKSPITFKPIRLSKYVFKVYICVYSIPDEFRNETFLVENKRGGDLKLDTPPSSVFDVISYMKYLVDEYKPMFLDKQEGLFVETRFSEDLPRLMTIFNNLLRA